MNYKVVRKGTICLVGSRPISIHFPYFPYTTGTLLSVALLLNPKMGAFVYVLGPCRSFKQTSRSWETGSFFHYLNPHWVLQPEVTRLYFSGAGTLGYMVQPGVGIASSPGVPHSFCQPHVNVGLPVPPATATASPLPQCYHLVSATPCPLHPSSTPPSRLDEYFFFKSLVVRLPYSSIFWQCSCL